MSTPRTRHPRTFSSRAPTAVPERVRLAGGGVSEEEQ
jgi:hypothetical protein